MPSLWLGVCDCNLPIDLYSRIGCFTVCFHLRRMEFWPSRHMRLGPMRARPYSWLALQHWSSFLLGFTTRGMPLPITSCPTNGERRRVSEIAEERTPKMETAAERWPINRKLAPQVGLEPTTPRLTAECSAIELLRNNSAAQLSI